jgi:hypothetical protein
VNEGGGARAEPLGKHRDSIWGLKLLFRALFNLQKESEIMKMSKFVFVDIAVPKDH